jgi:hypothetical protein
MYHSFRLAHFFGIRKTIAVLFYMMMSVTHRLGRNRNADHSDSEVRYSVEGRTLFNTDIQLEESRRSPQYFWKFCF